MSKINIIGVMNGSGLTVDYHVLKQEFEKYGASVNFVDVRVGAISHADSNIFLEILEPKYFAYAKQNFMVPNQEYFLPRWQNDLKDVDLILCKTRYAENIFRKLTDRVFYTGFDSTLYSAIDTNLRTERSGIAHICGKSKTKGTINLLNFWARNPDLPMLDVFYHTRELEFNLRPKNVRFHLGLKNRSEMAEIYNKYEFFMCPSPFEGFGHYINQAMGHGGIVLTTNGMPMNELVLHTGNGFLLKAKAVGVMNFSDVYEVNYNKDFLLNIFGSSTEFKEGLSLRASASFFVRRMEFQRNIKALWKSYLF